jgi:hypothetical protein
MRRAGAPVVWLAVICLLLAACSAQPTSGQRPTQSPTINAPNPGQGGQGLGNCARTSVGFTPLTELQTGTYQGFTGGLYPGGSNLPPDTYLETGLARAAQVQSVDADGTPDPGGKIVLLTIGMSNTLYESDQFVHDANADSNKSPQVVIVNGAQGGQDAEKIKTASAAYWQQWVPTQLQRAGVTANQVEAVWLKEAIAGGGGHFPDDARLLQTDLAAIVAILAQRFPNLQLVYLSSRIYAGYATTQLNPEPNAYESGFAVKWLIEANIRSSTQGSTARPGLAWGPYLWADGTRLRADGLVWNCTDLRADGTHPSPAGAEKVARMLLTFFESDPTARGWFLQA